MMTRRHYVDFLDRLRAERNEFNLRDYLRVVNIAANFFAADNPRFDRGRFLDYADPGRGHNR